MPLIRPTIETSHSSEPEIALKPRARCPEIGMAYRKGLIGALSSNMMEEALYFGNVGLNNTECRAR